MTTVPSGSSLSIPTSVAIRSPLPLYAMNKAVDSDLQERAWLRLKETPVTDKYSSIREGKK